MRNSYRI